MGKRRKRHTRSENREILRVALDRTNEPVTKYRLHKDTEIPRKTLDELLTAMHGRGYLVYFIKRDRTRELDEYRKGAVMLTKAKYDEVVYGMPTDLQSLKTMYKSMKSKGTNPESMCFVFIGDVPFAFGKDPHLLSEHMALEKNLRERYLRDFARFKERFEKAHPKYYLDPDGFNKLVHPALDEEIGATIGEYIRKLMARTTTKKKSLLMMFKFYGFTDAMIEELTQGTASMEELILRAGEKGLLLEDL